MISSHPTGGSRTHAAASRAGLWRWIRSRSRRASRAPSTGASWASLTPTLKLLRLRADLEEIGEGLRRVNAFGDEVIIAGTFLGGEVLGGELWPLRLCLLVAACSRLF